MRNSLKLRANLFVMPALLLAAACGKGDDAASDASGKAAVQSAADASVTDLDLDASTADAMSVDVAAGGVEPMADAVAVAAAPAETETAAPETPPAQ